MPTPLETPTEPAPPRRAGLQPPAPRAGWTPLPRERRLWLLTWAAVVGLLLARVPHTRAGVAQRVDALVASGDLPTTDQLDLAVNLGLLASLLISALVPFVVLAVVRRLQPRLRLPVVTLTGRSVPGALLVVGPVLLVKQLVPLVTGSLTPRSDAVVWVAAALTLLLATLAVVRAARAGGAGPAAVRRVGLAAALVGLVAVVL